MFQDMTLVFIGDSTFRDIAHSVLQDVFGMDRISTATDYLQHRHGVVAHVVGESLRVVFVYPPGIQGDTPPLPTYTMPALMLNSSMGRKGKSFAPGWAAALEHATALHSSYEDEAIERGSGRGLKLVVFLGGIFMNVTVIDTARAWLGHMLSRAEIESPMRSIALVLRSNGPSNMKHASDLENVRFAAAARAWQRTAPVPVLFWDVYAMLLKVWPFMLAGEPKHLRSVGASLVPSRNAVISDGGACSCHWAHKDASGIAGPVNAELARQALRLAEFASNPPGVNLGL